MSYYLQRCRQLFSMVCFVISRHVCFSFRSVSNAFYACFLSYSYYIECFGTGVCFICVTLYSSLLWCPPSSAANLPRSSLLSPDRKTTARQHHVPSGRSLYAVQIAILQLSGLFLQFIYKIAIILYTAIEVSQQLAVYIVI